MAAEFDLGEAWRRVAENGDRLRRCVCANITGRDRRGVWPSGRGMRSPRMTLQCVTLFRHSTTSSFNVEDMLFSELCIARYVLLGVRKVLKHFGKILFPEGNSGDA
jgi:hypothetical protein